MKEHIANKLRQWALMAEALTSTHYSHDRRWQRVQVLRRLIIRETTVNSFTNSLPLWADTLISILDATHFETGTISYIDHTEAKNTLRLFGDMCHYIIKRWDDSMWFSWAKEEYNFHTGEVVVNRPSTHHSLFVPIEDDTKSEGDNDDDNPFASAMDDIEF